MCELCEAALLPVLGWSQWPAGDHLEQLSSAPHLAGMVQGAGCRAAVCTSASKSSIRRFVITEKAPTRAFSWLKAFTFKTLLRHYAKQALTPWSLNVKLGPQGNYHKGRAAIRH